MGDKKDRGRFTIKFNENDPAHETVIGILEQQGPRQKAQFIANAVLHYIHCRETPDIAVPCFQRPDKTAIEAIVMEILRQQGMKKTETEGEHLICLTEKKGVMAPAQSECYQSDLQTLDDDMRDLIASTMLAFRSD